MRSKRNRTGTKKYEHEDQQEVRATGNRLGGLDRKPSTDEPSTDDPAIKVTAPAAKCNVEDAGITVVDSRDNFGNNEVIISSIAQDSPFYDSDLKIGMAIVSINNYSCPNVDKAKHNLNPMAGRIEIVAKAGKTILSTPTKTKKRNTLGEDSPLMALVRRGTQLTTGKKKPLDVNKTKTTRFHKTPGKASDRHKNNFQRTVIQSIKAVGSTILPNRSEERRKEIMKDPILKYYDKERGKLI